MTLHQAKVLVTREEKQSKIFADKIKKSGGIAIEVPLLEIACKQTAATKAILQQLAAYDWLFFTSANGVRCFYELLEQYDISFYTLAHIRIAVVGHKTEKSLLTYGYREADFMPTVYDAHHMAEAFIKQFGTSERILLVRGNLSRPTLPKHLQKAGILFDTIQVYETTVAEKSKDLLQQVLQDETIDFLTFSSPSAIDAFVKLAEDKQELSVTATCVCIGNTTKARAESVGFKHILVPSQYTIEGMLDCMEKQS